MKIRISAIIIGILAVSLSSCGYMRVDTKTRLADESWKAQSKTSYKRIQVFDEGQKAPSFEEVASIEATGTPTSTNGDLVEAMKRRASRLGADALVDVRFFTRPVLGGDGGGMFCPFDQPCYYMENERATVGLPAAESKAVVLKED